MSDYKRTHKSEEANFRVRPRLWNPNAKDDDDKKRFQTSKVASLQTPSDDIYLPEDRPQVMISNAIKDEDLPKCTTKSQCQDTHPAERVYVGLDTINNRHKLLHDKWSNHDIKVFTAKYQTLESNKDKKFDLIAKALTNKTAEDCKEFYYLYKHILRFKGPERVRKQKIKKRKKSLLELKEPCTSRLRLARKTSEKFFDNTTLNKKTATHSQNRRSLFNNQNKALAPVNMCNLVLLADVCNGFPNDKLKSQLNEEKCDSTKKANKERVDVMGQREGLCVAQNGNIEKSTTKLKRQTDDNDATRMRRPIKRPKKMDL